MAGGRGGDGGAEHVADFTWTKRILVALALVLLLGGVAFGWSAFEHLGEPGGDKSLVTLLLAIAAACSLTGSAVSLAGDALIRLLERAQR